MDASLRRRLLALTITVLLVLPLSVVAARWQWTRHLEREAVNSLLREAVATPVADFPGPLRNGYQSTDRYRQVRVSGRWDGSEQWLLRRSVVNGRVGFAVVTAFVSESGERLFAIRGWLPEPEVPPVDAAPETVVLRIQPLSGETGPQPADLPARQLNWVAPAELAAGQPFVNALFELVDPVPAPLVAIPLPAQEAGPHVGYTIQWILIGLTAVVVYVRVMRRELQDSNEN